MARKSRIRRVRSYVSRSYRRAKPLMSNLGLGSILTSLAYGAIRPRIVNNPSMQSVYSKLPFGEINDEVVHGVIAIAAKKFVRNSTVSNFADKILTIEAYRIGEVKLGGMSSTTTSSSTAYMYG